MTQIQEQVKALQTRIFAEAWFVRQWNDILIRQKMVPSGIDQGMYTDKQLVLLCHYMWEALPDEGSIRTGPFFQLCNVAEHIFD